MRHLIKWLHWSMNKINDDNEIQFRQVNPVWMEDDGPSRLVFLPTSKDDNLLSLDRSATTSEKDSHSNFTALGLRSAGVCGITISEFGEQPNAVECFESPLEHNPHHSHADFTDLSKSEKKAKSQELRRKAVARGMWKP